MVSTATEAIALDKDAFMRLVTQERLKVEGPIGGYLYTGKQGRDGWEMYRAPQGYDKAEWYDVASPAAATDWNRTVPIDEEWVLLGIAMTYVADANVADRTVKLYIQDDATSATTHWYGQFGAVTAGQTATLIAHTGILTADTTGAEQILNLPTEMVLPAGSYILSSTTNKQVGDDFTVIQLHVKRRSV